MKFTFPCCILFAVITLHANAGPAPAPSSSTATQLPWPGSKSVHTIDVENTWSQDVSGVVYQDASAKSEAVIWTVRNKDPAIFKLVSNGTFWVFAEGDGWSQGKKIHYADGTGEPDGEGLTKTEYREDEFYVATERDNADKKVPRLSILRFQDDAKATELSATHEWNLRELLPTPTEENLGLEAIRWIPDSFLVGQGFYDQGKGTAYDPSAYPSHGNGLFFTGLEEDGRIYVVALNHDDCDANNQCSSKLIASFSSGRSSVSGLAFDREMGLLWATQDVGNVLRRRLGGVHKAGILSTDTGGAAWTTSANVFQINCGDFQLVSEFEFPAEGLGIAGDGNEGFAISASSSCVDGYKPVFFADDGNTNGHSLREGNIPCDRSAFILKPILPCPDSMTKMPTKMPTNKPTIPPSPSPINAPHTGDNDGDDGDSKEDDEGGGQDD